MDRTQFLWRIGNRVESFELRRFGLSPMAVLNPADLLVIETSGRRTGRTRFTPIAYWQEGPGVFMVGGGAAGKTNTPDWVANLRHQPEAAVWVKRTRIPILATELQGSERDAAQSKAATIWRGVERYEQMSGRAIPYFRLIASPTIHAP